MKHWTTQSSGSCFSSRPEQESFLQQPLWALGSWLSCAKQSTQSLYWCVRSSSLTVSNIWDLKNNRDTRLLWSCLQLAVLALYQWMIQLGHPRLLVAVSLKVTCCSKVNCSKVGVSVSRCAWGYHIHVYTDKWDTAVGKELEYVSEKNNLKDLYAGTVLSAPNHRQYMPKIYKYNWTRNSQQPNVIFL